MGNRPQQAARSRPHGVGAAILCFLFIACASSRVAAPPPAPASAPPPPAPPPPAAITPSGTATGATTGWRLTGQAESKNRCGMMEPPVEISHAEADYPEAVRRQGVSGTVVLQGTLSGTGVPAAIKVIQSADPRLSSLALEAFQAWRYKPAICDGNPIGTYVTATFSFKLKPGSP